MVLLEQVMTFYSTITKLVTETIAVVLFFTVLVLQTANIFFRYSGVRPPAMWVEDFSKYALIWIFFLVWHLADRQQQHFAVDIFGPKLPPRAKKAMSAFVHLVAIGFSVVVIWSSFKFIPTIMGYPTQSFRWLPMGVVCLVIPVGLTLVVVERCRMFIYVCKSTADLDNRGGDGR
jgi:TRAP-type C4-dicarboxylate transport system permease small subunit